MRRTVRSLLACLVVMAGIVIAPMQAIAEPTTVSGSVFEGELLTLTAPAGMVFTSVVFASYGTPSGTTITECHATTSTTEVSAAFIGKNSGSIYATNDVFGDPCGGTYKWLTVVLAYGEAKGTRVVTPGSCASRSYRATLVSRGQGAVKNAWAWCQANGVR